MTVPATRKRFQILYIHSHFRQKSWYVTRGDVQFGRIDHEMDLLMVTFELRRYCDRYPGAFA